MSTYARSHTHTLTHSHTHTHTNAHTLTYTHIHTNAHTHKHLTHSHIGTCPDNTYVHAHAHERKHVPEASAVYFTCMLLSPILYISKYHTLSHHM